MHVPVSVCLFTYMIVEPYFHQQAFSSCQIFATNLNLDKLEVGKVRGVIFAEQVKAPAETLHNNLQGFDVVVLFGTILDYFLAVCDCSGLFPAY